MDALDPRNQCADGIRSACPSTAPNRLERGAKAITSMAEKHITRENGCGDELVSLGLSLTVDLALGGLGRIGSGIITIARAELWWSRQLNCGERGTG